ncbi:FAD-dependent oxidoreductase, partial [Myxococcota bacterium]|nr:FAD-dependent oxidoreductase [Myxococcota bacterium]
TVIWAAGVRGSSLAEQLGVELGHGGRVPVEPDLTIASRPDVRVVGDLAQISDPRSGTPVPGVAQGALQMGRYAGKCIRLALKGDPDAGKKKPFTYFDKGTMATVGRGKAVLESNGVRLWGFPAWVVWALIHIFFLVGFRSRLAAMWSWAWAYIFSSANNEIISGPVQRHVDPDSTPDTAATKPQP